MTTSLIAVDPGAQGGIAILAGETSKAEAYKMPATRRELIELLRTHKSPGQTIYIEKISGYIGHAGAHQMFEFGRLVERVEAIAECLYYRILLVTPQKWQQALSLGKIGTVRAPAGSTEEARKAIRAANARAKTAWKNKLKSEAERRFPHIKVTLATADALLILEYARIAERDSSFLARSWLD